MVFGSPSSLRLGHRGVPGAARENTIESFRKALQAGLDGVELDVHRSKDGVLVVHHDAEIEGHPIAQTRWDDLKQQAPWLPRLDEVFELFDQHPAAKLNIELKSEPPMTDGREQALVKAVSAWGGRGRVWVSCFDPLALIRLKREGLEAPLALLLAQEEMFELLDCLPIQGVHPHFTLLNKDAVSALKAKGLFVVAWTVNSKSAAQKLAGWGVDGLIGDEPAELVF